MYFRMFGKCGVRGYHAIAGADHAFYRGLRAFRGKTRFVSIRALYSRNLVIFKPCQRKGYRVLMK